MKRLVALAAVPLLATACLIGLGVGRASAVPQPAQATPSQSCILIIFCTSSSPTPSVSSPAPSASSTPSSSAATSPTPSAGPTATPGPSPSQDASPSASASPSVSGVSVSGSPTLAVTATPSRKPRVTRKDGTVAQGLTAASAATWTMSVDTATMTGFNYAGNVNLPLAGGGTILMMEFTADSMAMSGATTEITEGGVTGKETDAAFSASGVTLYATRLSGSILGVPVTFTPSTASAILLSITNLLTGVVPITMTGVTVDQGVILASQAQKTGVSAVG
jgi:hypothetical protein